MLSLKGTHVDGERFEYVPTLPPPLLLEGIRENSGTAHAETSAVKSYHIPHITIKPSCRTSNKKAKRTLRVPTALPFIDRMESKPKSLKPCFQQIHHNTTQNAKQESK